MVNGFALAEGQDSTSANLLNWQTNKNTDLRTKKPLSLSDILWLKGQLWQWTTLESWFLYCLSMLHAHVPMLYSYVQVSMLHVYSACPYCIFMHHVHAPCPVSMSSLQAACPCYMSLCLHILLSCCVPMLHVRHMLHIRVPMLHVHAACPHCMSTLQCPQCMSTLHVHAACLRCMNMLDEHAA